MSATFLASLYALNSAFEISASSFNTPSSTVAFFKADVGNLPSELNTIPDKAFDSLSIENAGSTFLSSSFKFSSLLDAINASSSLAICTMLSGSLTSFVESKCSFNIFS